MEEETEERGHTFEQIHAIEFSQKVLRSDFSVAARSRRR